MGKKITKSKPTEPTYNYIDKFYFSKIKAKPKIDLIRLSNINPLDITTINRILIENGFSMISDNKIRLELFDDEKIYKP